MVWAKEKVIKRKKEKIVIEIGIEEVEVEISLLTLIVNAEVLFFMVSMLRRR